MQELGTQLGRYVSGLIDIDELRDEFLRYISRHPNERDAVQRWLDEAVRKGRLAPSIGDLLSAAIATRARPVTVSAGESSEPFTRRPTIQSILAREDATPGRRKGEQHGDPLTLQPGSVVRERFVLMEELGRGGMGQVFKAKDLRREEAQDRQPFVALKVLSSDFSAHPDSFIALQREARRASMLAHPNVVTVFDFDRDGSRIYMTMEYLEGRGLDTYLRSDCAKGVPFATAWPIIRGVGAALEYAHQKRIIHSDLKPGNVFLCNDGAVKVLDFGIARLTRPVDSQTDVTIFDAGDRLGGLTPAYASLEMWNREPPDPRDDLYALACVTYELLSGKHPYGRASAKDAFSKAQTPKRIDSLTRRQWDALKRGLALHRDQRTASIAEFIQGLTPRSRLRRLALPIALAATAAVAAVLTVGARYYKDVVQEDQLEGLCAEPPRTLPEPEPRPPLTEEEMKQVEENLSIAEENMAEVRGNTSVQELNELLTAGNNSANYVVDRALLIDPRNQRAFDLKARIAQEYENRALAARAAKQYEDALELVQSARIVQPSSQQLFRLEQSICSAAAR